MRETRVQNRDTFCKQTLLSFFASTPKFGFFFGKIENLYLFSGLSQFEAKFLCTQDPHAQWPAIFRFWCHFFANALRFFGQHDSPSNLAESWYHQQAPFVTISSLNAVKGCRSVPKQVVPRQQLLASPPRATSSSKFVGCAFLQVQVPISTRGFAFAPPFHG